LMIHSRIGEYFPAKAEKWKIRIIIIIIIIIITIIMISPDEVSIGSLTIPNSIPDRVNILYLLC
jgi:uncharacterized integral membrane protein